MDSLHTPLSREEIQDLDKFLLYRTHSDEELDAIEDDEGISTLPELDGLMAALCCCQEMIVPSIWLDWIWGSEAYAPKWIDEKQATHYIGLIMRHYNTVAADLMEGIGFYEPLFYERKVKGNTYLIVDEWCEGFMLVVKSHPGAWQDQEKDIEHIAIFTKSREFAAHDSGNAAALQKEIEPAVLRMHKRRLATFNHENRNEIVTSSIPPKVGRNEPCTCGSGRKYKKCCGWN